MHRLERQRPNLERGRPRTIAAGTGHRVNMDEVAPREENAMETMTKRIDPAMLAGLLTAPVSVEHGHGTEATLRPAGRRVGAAGRRRPPGYARRSAGPWLKPARRASRPKMRWRNSGNGNWAAPAGNCWKLSAPRPIPPRPGPPANSGRPRPEAAHMSRTVRRDPTTARQRATHGNGTPPRGGGASVVLSPVKARQRGHRAAGTQAGTLPDAAQAESGAGNGKTSGPVAPGSIRNAAGRICSDGRRATKKPPARNY